jgi:hypothetical protein
VRSRWMPMLAVPCDTCKEGCVGGTPGARMTWVRRDRTTTGGHKFQAFTGLPIRSQECHASAAIARRHNTRGARERVTKMAAGSSPR